MKSGLRRIFSGVLVIALAIALSAPAFAYDLKSFKDVPADFWAHDAIMDMVERGMFSGTTAPDQKGVGTFAPNSPMTRAAFIAVVTRYLYAGELAGMKAEDGAVWYANNYAVALKHGLLKSGELDNGDLSKTMTRQEMAMVLARACELTGEDVSQTIENSRIPDYSAIGSYYRDYVKAVYTKGLIAGTDSKGTFNPQGTLNRAQAATVIYRLIEPSTRNPIDAEVATGSSWTEGQPHGEPKVGDKVTTKSGQTVVLQEKIGVLGFGQGVDIYTNVVYNGVSAKEGMASWFDQTRFIKSGLTGEMYTSQQWKAIKRDSSC